MCRSFRGDSVDDRVMAFLQFYSGRRTGVRYPAVADANKADTKEQSAGRSEHWKGHGRHNLFRSSTLLMRKNNR